MLLNNMDMDMNPIKALKDYFSESARACRRLDSLRVTAQACLSHPPCAPVTSLISQCTDMAARFGHLQEVADTLTDIAQSVQNRLPPDDRQASQLAAEIASAAARMRDEQSEEADAWEHYEPEHYKDEIALWRQKESRQDKIRGALTRQMADIWLSSMRAGFQQDMRQNKSAPEYFSRTLLIYNVQASSTLLKTASFWMRRASGTFIDELNQKYEYPATKKERISTPCP